MSPLSLKMYDNIATQLNAKFCAAFFILLSARALALAFSLRPPPNTFIKIISGVFFVVTELTTDPLFDVQRVGLFKGDSED
jgi:hypothetical protein